MANKKMWLRNWDNLFTAVFGYNNIGSTTTDNPTHDTVWFRRMDNGVYWRPGSGGAWSGGVLAQSLGINQSRGWVYNMGYTRTSTSNYAQRAYDYQPCGIILGTGDSEPSYDGYNVLSPITSGMAIGTVKGGGTVYDAETHTYTKTIVIPIIYSGTNPITVNEFGISVLLPQSEDSYQGVYAYPVMVYHEVFEEGITLQTNDTIEITFSQSIVQPNWCEYPGQTQTT